MSDERTSNARALRVLLVTSWDTPCGIAEYARLLKESVQRAAPKIEILPDSDALDPESYAVRSLYHDMRESGIDILHLNHHDGLHSRWTPDHVKRFTDAGMPVLVTYHDTRAVLAECPKLAALAAVASSVVVHEPVEGLQAIYWRQGVPAAAQQPHAYLKASMESFGSMHTSFKAFPQQPVLGTCGFNFPWKNYDRLAQVTGEEGWALVILSNNATTEDEQRWKSLNSAILVVREFLLQDQVVNYLAGCDATVFMYECANTGTSGAIRQGIAARKPVIALGSCRQFRDLLLDDRGAHALDWVLDWDEFRERLASTHGGPVCNMVHALAHAESWEKLGRNYAELYRLLAGGS
jgi:hypothetical protein